MGVTGKKSIRTKIDLRGKSDDEISEFSEGCHSIYTKRVWIRIESHFLYGFTGHIVGWTEVVSIQSHDLGDE